MNDNFCYKYVCKLCGHHFTLKEYSIDLFSRADSIRVSYGKSCEGEKRSDSIYRTRTNIIDTINCNLTAYTKFITFTFKESVLDKSVALSHFSNFKKRFERVFGYKLKYLMVAERQKKRGLKENNEGSYHFHMVCFNSCKIDFKKLKSCWKIGSVDIKKIDSVYNIGRYIAKYISKDNIDCSLNDRLIYTSVGLKKPKVSKLSSFDCSNINDKLTYQSSYIYNNNGIPISCLYKEFDLSK